MRAIFISYRREDAEGQAGRLFNDLVEHFGEQSVFMDVATIEPGRDFRKAIDEHVASCGVLLALIGKSWVDARDQTGRRRLDDPLDFVRLETSAALKRDISVVPVLVHGASMPRTDQLPADLADLAFRNAIELTHTRWDSDLTVLVKALSHYVMPLQADAADRGNIERGKQTPAPSSQIQRRLVMAVVIATVLMLAAAGVYFLKPSSPQSQWHVATFPPPNAGEVAFTIMPDGNPACASYDENACLWGVPIADLDFSKLRPLVCGEMHRARWNTTGYEDPKHWCSLAKVVATAQ
jgi:TIR domain